MEPPVLHRAIYSISEARKQIVSIVSGRMRKAGFIASRCGARLRQCDSTRPFANPVRVSRPDGTGGLRAVLQASFHSSFEIALAEEGADARSHCTHSGIIQNRTFPSPW